MAARCDYIQLAQRSIAVNLVPLEVAEVDLTRHEGRGRGIQLL